MTDPLIIIVGAGPGLGAAVARRFGAAGYAVALIGRTPDRLRRLAEDLQSAGVHANWSAVDVTHAAALAAAVEQLAQAAGRVDVLHFNPSVYRPRTALELTAEELLEDVRLGVAALLTAVQAARPFMREGARVVVTGSAAADRPSPAAASLGV